jgi:hypothetical protein
MQVHPTVASLPFHQQQRPVDVSPLLAGPLQQRIAMPFGVKAQQMTGRPREGTVANSERQRAWSSAVVSNHDMGAVGEGHEPVAVKARVGHAEWQ